MALRTIAYTTTIYDWVDKYNSLSNDAGDLVLLTTTAKNSLVAAINEHDAEIGTISALNDAIEGVSLVVTINNFYTAYSAFVTATNNTLAEYNTRMGALTSIDTAIRGVSLAVSLNNEYNRVGVLSSLTTTAKNSIVAAINEHDIEIGTISALNDAIEGVSLVVTINNFYTAYSTFTTNTNSTLTEYNTRMGALTSINTAIRGVSLAVSIENEYNRVGALATLNDAIEGASIVASINNFYTAYSTFVTSTNTSISTLNNTTSEHNTRMGALTSIDVAIRGVSLAVSLNNFYTAYASYTSTTNGRLNTLESNRTEHNTRMGALADLRTNIKTAIDISDGGSLVQAINYVYDLGTGATVEFTNANLSGTLTVGGFSSFTSGANVTGGNFTSRGISDAATANRVAITNDLITLKTATTLDTTLNVTGTSTFATVNTSNLTSSSFRVQNTQPQFDLFETDGALNSKYWRHVVNNNAYAFDLVNDAYNAATAVYTITRTGTTSAVFNFSSAVTLQYNGNTIWHAGNQGAGTGLDADRLDGQDGTFYTDIPARLGYTPLNSASYTAADVLAKLLTVDTDTSGLNADTLDGQQGSFYTDIPARLGYTPLNSASYTAADVLAKLLTVDTDTSGLNADTLDGQQGSYYTNIPARLGYTPLNSASYTAADILSKLLTVDGTGSGLDADRLDNLDSSAFAQVTGATFTGDVTVYRSAAPTTGVVFLNQTNSRYLFYDGSNYIMPGSQLYVNGQIVWNAGNGGAGTGLDADLLDAQHGSYYRSRANHTGTQPWSTITSTPTTLAGYGITDGLSSSTYTAADVLAKLLTVDTDTSGLNADTLDSQQGSHYLARANHTGTQAWSTITSTPTTLAGYGITDGLSSSVYTAADVLAKLLTVDTDTSGLNADTLDGQQGAYYADIPARLGYTPLNSASYTAADVLAKLLTVDTDTSGLNADTLDGQQGSYYTNITARLGYTPFNSAGGTLSGNLSVTGTISSTGDITAFSSDARLKDISNDKIKALDIVDSLHGYFFRWNKNAIERTPSLDDVDRRIGLLAQEVEKVLPEAMGPEIDGYKTVRYEAIIPVLVEAIRELKEEIRRGRT